jgi:hypothetical protein
MVLDKQVLLPGQAIVSLATFNEKIGPYGNKLYRAVFRHSQDSRITSIEDNYSFFDFDYSLFDFSYYLASESSIKKLVNYESITRKKDRLTTGFSQDDFAILERYFKGHRGAMKGIYMISLRGGRINYI